MSDATVEVDGQPVVNGTGIGTFTVDADTPAGNAGQDTVTVEADELSNPITVSDTMVDITGLKTVNLAREDALIIEAAQGVTETYQGVRQRRADDDEGESPRVI